MTSIMEANEDKVCSVWESFKTKVEDLFVTGYNLPSVLQVLAVDDVEKKLVLWKGKLSVPESELTEEIPALSSFTEGEVSNDEHDEELSQSVAVEEVPKDLRHESLNESEVNKDNEVSDVVLVSHVRPPRRNRSRPKRFEDGHSPEEKKRHTTLKKPKAEKTLPTTPQKDTVQAEGNLTLPPKVQKDSTETRENSTVPSESLKDSHKQEKKSTALCTSEPNDSVQTDIEIAQSDSTRNSISAEKSSSARSETKHDLVQSSESKEDGGEISRFLSELQKNQADTVPSQPEDEAGRKVEMPVTPKRGRGRPPGSKTKNRTVKKEKMGDENAGLLTTENIKKEIGGDSAGHPPPDVNTPVRRKRGRPRRIGPRPVKGEKNFPCDQCENRYGTFQRLEKHKRIHQSGPIKCPDCPKTFLSHSGYDVHVRLHTGEGLHSCMHCNYVTGSRGMLASHIRRVHEKVRRHLCDTCGKGFVTAYMLKRHIEAIHMKDIFKDAFMCEFCDFKTHSEACLKSHVRNRHTSQPGFKCTLCGLILKYKNSLLEHEQRHYSIKNFCCNKCDFKAICEGDLRKHVRRHHINAKRFKCEECHKSFKQKVHLLRHSSIHTGAKDYMCSQCTYRCNDKSNLAKHLWHVHKLKEARKRVLIKIDQLQEVEVTEVAEVQEYPDETTTTTATQLFPIEATSDNIIIEEQTEIVQPIIVPVEEQYEVVQNIEYWS